LWISCKSHVYILISFSHLASKVGFRKEQKLQFFNEIRKRRFRKSSYPTCSHKYWELVFKEIENLVTGPTRGVQFRRLWLWAKPLTTFYFRELVAMSDLRFDEVFIKTVEKTLPTYFSSRLATWNISNKDVSCLQTDRTVNKYAVN
jgi:hypothetical protein